MSIHTSTPLSLGIRRRCGWRPYYSTVRLSSPCSLLRLSSVGTKEKRRSRPTTARAKRKTFVKAIRPNTAGALYCPRYIAILRSHIKTRKETASVRGRAALVSQYHPVVADWLGRVMHQRFVLGLIVCVHEEVPMLRRPAVSGMCVFSSVRRFLP